MEYIYIVRNRLSKITSTSDEIFHLFAVRKIIEVIYQTKLLCTLEKDSCRDTSSMEWCQSIWMSDIAPFFPIYEALKNRSVFVLCNFDKFVDMWLCYNAVWTPRLTSFLIDTSHENCNKLLVCVDLFNKRSFEIIYITERLNTMT